MYPAVKILYKYGPIVKAIWDFTRQSQGKFCCQISIAPNCLTSVMDHLTFLVLDSLSFLGMVSLAILVMSSMVLLVISTHHLLVMCSVAWLVIGALALLLKVFLIFVNCVIWSSCWGLDLLCHGFLGLFDLMLICVIYYVLQDLLSPDFFGFVCDGLLDL